MTGEIQSFEDLKKTLQRCDVSVLIWTSLYVQMLRQYLYISFFIAFGSQIRAHSRDGGRNLSSDEKLTIKKIQMR